MGGSKFCTTVYLSDLENISEPGDIVEKDLKKHITISSIPANIPNLEYAGLEVLYKSNKNALSIACTNVTFTFKTSRMKQEIRNRTVAEEISKVYRGNAAKLFLLPMSVLQVATQMWWLTLCYLINYLLIIFRILKADSGKNRAV